MNKIRCISVDVYKCPLGDCSNRGISSRFNALLIPCRDGNLSFDADEMIPLNFCAIGERGGYSYIVPAAIDDGGHIVQRGGYWYMYGGNIASSSDSRLWQAAGHPYPLKIHDRRE